MSVAKAEAPAKAHREDMAELPRGPKVKSKKSHFKILEPSTLAAITRIVGDEKEKSEKPPSMFELLTLSPQERLDATVEMHNMRALLLLRLANRD